MWNGISRGDLSANNIAYLDSFGAALEYDNRGDDNVANEGVALYAKLKVPALTKKMTYFAGHVGAPSAYRMQIYDGTNFVNLTTSSAKINAAYAAVDEGWTLTSQLYNGSDTLEVAIPEEFVGAEVMIVFSAKHHGGASFGMRANNFAFSKSEIIVPPSLSDGIDLDVLNAGTAITAASYDFATDADGFTLNWGAAADAAGNITMTGVALSDGVPSNAAMSAKITVPAFNFLRLTVSGEAGKIAQVRMRAIDLEAKTAANIIGWTDVTGAEEQVIQIQSVPTQFTATCGFVIEMRYKATETATTLKIGKIEFASYNRDADGYDFDAMGYTPYRAMPDTNKLTFTAEEFAKWGIYTSHADDNTKGFHNNIWLQLQSTNNTGAYSALAAYNTTIPNLASLEIKAGSIDASFALTSKIRIRAKLADNTFVNFVTEGKTDENGWFNAVGGTEADNLVFGKTYITSGITVPESIKGQKAMIIIEYDRETSTNWNVIIEYLAFS